MERHSASVDDDVYWTQYDPPDALSKLPNITSETIIAVVHSSLENVRTQIEVEKQRRLEVEASIKEEAEAEVAAAAAAAASEQEAAEARKNKGKAREEAPAAHTPSLLAREGSSQHLDDTPLPDMPRKRQKRSSRFGVFRIFTRGGSEQHGESSRSILSSYHPTNARNSSTLPDQAQPPTPFTKLIYKTLKPPIEPVADNDTVECVSCFDDIPPRDGIKTICHHYCKSCFIRLVQTALENEAQWPPKCCLNPVPQRTILKYIPADLKKSYQAKDEEFRMPIEHRLYCSQPDCGLWIRKERQQLASRTATCPSGHVICTICRGATHPLDEACPQDRDMQLTNQLAADEGWRRCDKCSALVEHREACQHMTCRCGNEFCYVCGATWRTCLCSMEMLAAVKNQAAARRKARTAEEEIEAEQLREALQMVAEFEAAEERKEAKRRAKAAKKLAEARRREAAERARREEDRRAALDKKYRELESTLAKLNELQRTVLSYAHDRAMDETVREAAAARHQLQQKQEKERHQLRAACKAKLAEKKRQRERDWATRVLWEKYLESKWETVLSLFWETYVDGGAQVKQAMDLYRERNDALFDKWVKLKEDEIEKVTYMLDDELIIQTELAADAKQRLEEKLAADGAEIGRKHRAEGKWFEVVTAERARLLAEVEVLERENGREESSDDGLGDLLDWHGEMELDDELESEWEGEEGEEAVEDGEREVPEFPGAFPCWVDLEA